ncbi:hypothetical protein OAS1_03060 [Bacillus sp. YKCMOAS1]|nr:hypothetical protein OAS1_03060 [Bacillus sp. YKCMOAS1]
MVRRYTSVESHFNKSISMKLNTAIIITMTNSLLNSLIFTINPVQAAMAVINKMDKLARTWPSLSMPITIDANPINTKYSNKLIA